MKEHILFTARDVGAAHHIKHIMRAFDKRGYRTSVIASSPAYEVLKREKLKPELFSVKGGKPFVPYRGSKKLVEDLLERSYKAVMRKNSMAVFCGLATIDYGIDEAVLYWTSHKRLNIPSFQFLDAWGTFNHFKNGYPNIYFAIDKATEKYSYKGAKAPIKIVGSPKHQAYSHKPIDKWRENFRRKLGINKNTKLIGYFGQDPEVPGYIENFQKLVEAIKQYNAKDKQKCELVVRLHPAYRKKFRFYQAILKKNKIKMIDVTYEANIEKILSACNIVATCYSTVGSDHAYLSYYAKHPIGAPLYLLCNDRVKKHLSKSFGYWKNPLLESGVGFYVDKPKEVFKKIEYILDDPLPQREYFEATKSLIHNDNPCGKIINIVSSFIEKNS